MGRRRDEARERARDETLHRSQRRQSRHRLRRRLSLALCVLLVVVGVAAAALGAWVEAHPDTRTPLPLAVPGTATLPERPLLAAPLVLYGARTSAQRATPEQLGCLVTGADGGERAGALSQEGARLEGRVVVEGQGLVPLLVVTAPGGSELGCDSARAVQAQPLYLLPGDSARDLVPLAAYSTAAVTLPFGLALLVLLGLYRRRP